MNLIHETFKKDPQRALSIAFEEAFDKSHGINPCIDVLVITADVTGVNFVRHSSIAEINLLYREYKIGYSTEFNKLTINFIDVIYDPLSDKDISKLSLLAGMLKRSGK